MTKGKRSKPPSLHIVLDTNALYTEAHDKLLAREISDYIKSASGETGIEIAWYLPSIVRQERHVQILENGRKLLPSLRKIEDLLGHRLNIGPDTLEPRVRDIIDREISAHELKSLELEPNEVDWPKLVENAVQKKPPFDPGPKEKGFKDAIILEIFCRLVDKLPRSAQTCRIVLLTQDGPLTEATNFRVNHTTNCVVLPKLEDLKNYINAIAAHLSSEEVERILGLAEAIFHRANDKSTLWYKSDIKAAIEAKLGSAGLPGPGSSFKIDSSEMLVEDAVFERKDARRILLTTAVSIIMTALSTGKGDSSEESTIFNESAISKLASIYSSDTANQYNNLALALLSRRPNIVRYKKRGQHQFAIDWEVNLLTNGSLNSPKLREIRYIGTNWSEEYRDNSSDFDLRVSPPKFG